VHAGSATPGIDFLPLDGTIVFPPLAGSATIEFPIFDNPWPEADRTIVVELKPASDQWQLGPPADRMTVYLLDDDRPGTVDGSFNAQDIFANAQNPPGVLAVIVQPDDKVLVGGTFLSVAGVPVHGITRLLPDGTLDESFVKGLGVQPEYSAVSAMARLDDGQVIIGGWFTEVHGVSRTNVARLSVDGTVDLGFDAGSIAAGSSVFALAVQADGKVLVGGQGFDTPQGFRHGIVRLLPDGSFDSTFAPKFPSDTTVELITVLQDGGILVGGYFTSVNDRPVGNLARLRPDGTLDTSFDAASAGLTWTKAVAVQSDGRLLVCCGYDGFSGPIKRLNQNGASTRVLTHESQSSWGTQLWPCNRMGRFL
jgi:uncharacterized delta-60 repeat protein